MQSTKQTSTQRANLNPNEREGTRLARASTSTKAGAPPSLADIRTTAREYANPVDYRHPYPSMARFADLLALHYDANRTRHATPASQTCHSTPNRHLRESFEVWKSILPVRPYPGMQSSIKGTMTGTSPALLPGAHAARRVA